MSTVRSNGRFFNLRQGRGEGATVRVAAASQLEPTVAALTTAEPTLNPAGDGFGVVVAEVRLQLRRQREDRLVRQAQVLVELGP